MVLRPARPTTQPIEWDEAFALIADELRALTSPDEAVFYTSGRTANEAAFLYQLFVRSFGTNNLPDCSNMCHESSGTALTESIGIGKGSVTPRRPPRRRPDRHRRARTRAPTIRACSPRWRRQRRNGAKIIAVNPLPRGRPDRASRIRRQVHGVVGRRHPDRRRVSCRSGSAATSRCSRRSARLLLEADDRAPGSGHRPRLRRRHTPASTRTRRAPAQLDLDDRGRGDRLRASRSSGSRAMLRRVADASIACWAMGLTQHRHAVATIAGDLQPAAAARQ